MSNILSTLATAIAAGNTPSVKHNVKVLDDQLTLPVATLASTEYARFGVIPAGAVIIPNMSLLTTTHGSTIPGKLTLVPVDGSDSTDITGVTANLEATETTSIPDAVAGTAVTKDSYVQFTPTSDTTISSTAKTLFLRLAYRMLA